MRRYGNPDNHRPLLVERRTMAREPSCVAAKVRWPRRRPIRAQLMDISESGCRIDTGLLMPGQSVQLTTDATGTIAAEVRWYRAGEAGLRFDTPLQPSDVTCLRSPLP